MQKLSLLGLPASMLVACILAPLISAAFSHKDGQGLCTEREQLMLLYMASQRLSMHLAHMLIQGKCNLG